MKPAFKSLLLLAVLSSGSLASDTWDTPCFEGECTAETSQWKMTVNGPKEVISDISEAADWIVLGCDPKASEQKVRIVCKADEETSGCKNLREGGEVNKLVRLPPQCSENGFARVAEFGEADDQDIPSEFSSSVEGTPKVYSLSFDADYKQIPTPSEPVKFRFASVTTPEGAEKANERRMVGAPPRFMFREDDYKEDFNSDDIDQHREFVLPLKNSTKEYSLLEPHFDCGVGMASGSATFKLSASADIDMTLAAGFKIRGNIIPPEVSLFHMYGKMDGHVAGSLKISGSATGSLDTDDVTVLDIPIAIPGIPSLLTIGPKFQLAVRLKADLDATIEQEIGFNYKLNELRMYFPQTEEHKNSGSVEAVETPMDLKLGGKSTTSLKLSAHVMPRLALGVTVPAGEAKLFAEIDISGTAGLSFEQTKEKELRRRADRFTEVARHAATRGVADKHDLARRDLESLKESGIEGCAFVSAQAAINVGASASFFGLFNSDPDHKYQVFGSEPWELFKKCTSDEADAAIKVTKPEDSMLSQEFAAAVEDLKYSGPGLNHRRSLPRRSSIESRGSKLECSADFHPGSLVTVLHQAVRAKKMKD
ncbi:hypothetical protein HGRIS_006471 [Hohenbuehelia grisea]|uniref:Uncharacterized protein n=1 Tax=Hohenbuehelia grisea TaxID=104357 RepID=A0ABR3K2Y7_9AGAR